MRHLTRHRTGSAAAMLTALALALSGCTESSAESSDTSTDATADVYDATVVHSLAIELDTADYEAMITAYQDSGEKQWISATVTIDGEQYEDVGLRLKGNSSLSSITTETDPSDVPWLVRLDKYVDDQSVGGYTEFVVRSSSGADVLNEAVSLDLLADAGLASEQAVATRLSVNGGAETLRLVVQNLDETWDEENFSSEGVLYKAEAGGDYSYRGEDAEAYTDVFDQETDTDTEDLTPLIDFLDFINNSDDATFEAELSDHLDVEAFATYLAFEELISNTDDIDGPGNNSYLRYDSETGSFTIVAWDHDGAFGGFGFGMGSGFGGGGGGQAGEGGQLPEGVELPEGFEPPADGEVPTDGELPEGFDPPEGGQPGGGGADGGISISGGSNVLVERFTGNATFNALYEQAKVDLQASLYDSGDAQTSLDRWVELLKADAADVVDTAEVDSTASTISGYFQPDAAEATG